MMSCPDSGQTLKKEYDAVVYAVMKHLQESEGILICPPTPAASGTREATCRDPGVPQNKTEEAGAAAAAAGSFFN